MDEREYERRKLELERQLEAGIELLRAGHRSQRTALDLVWAASLQNPGRGGLPYEVPLVSVSTPLPAARPADLPRPQVEARKRRWRPGELRDAVVAALSRIPEEFDRDDMLRALGTNPDRGSLYRIFQDLRLEGEIAEIQPGSGQKPARYRRLR
jgi:hypothetical protein